MNNTKQTEPHPFPYVNRDVSWMYFNHRILQEARRKDVPLLERLSFLGIYSANLDEFYRVRIATVSRLAQLAGGVMKEERHQARVLLEKLTGLDNRFSDEFSLAVSEATEALADEGIDLVRPDTLDDTDAHIVRCRFRKDISGYVAPLWLSHVAEFSQSSDSHIYLAVELSGPGRKTDYAVIPLPDEECGRFLTLPDRDGRQRIIYIDDVIRYSLPMIFPGMGYTDFKAYSFKFTRDAEMEIDNDLRVGRIEKVAKAVRNRKNGETLRVVYDAAMPQPMLRLLLRKMNAGKYDTLKPSGRYHNHKDFMGFPKLGRTDLLYKPQPPLVRTELKQTHSLLQLISERDRFVHVPYHSFDYVVRLLQEAAVSKNVKSIKITLYRVARDSKIVNALIAAARNGKRVTAVVELMARFDESSNIHWAKRMQDAGVNVVFGFDGIKVHSKIIHIGMRHGRSVALVGTGNFHEGNAKVYTDYFLMTARPDITSDVEKVFSFIKRPYKPVAFRSLIVSPNEMRDRFIRLIDQEIYNARRGIPAFIKIKINHITDPEMIARLYEASRAGVDIRLLVRGNCSLVTGIPDTSENIHAAGIIDRYLEHSRVFIFHAGGENRTFIGSADWMPRNLDDRVEVVTPVEDPEIKADLMKIVDLGLADNRQARIVDGTGRNLMSTGIDGPKPTPEPLRSQEAIYRWYADQLNADYKEKTAAD